MSSNELAATTNWINGIAVPPSPSDAVRLFCFPHAGGGASIFKAWTSELGPGIEVYPIQLPGREGRWFEPPLTQIPELIETLGEVLRPLLHPPYAFFGHSMGAFIAFELARQLRRQNRPGPATLIVSAARAPQIPDPDPPIHLLPADLLLEELGRFGGIPRELLSQPELVALLLPAIRADLTMCDTYEYRDEAPLECRLSVYGAENDEKVAVEHLTPWNIQSSGDFQLRVFPGNHFFFLKEARTAVVQALREELQRHGCLAAATSAPTPRADLEQVIADTWAELLRVSHVGIDDNFFDLGANSLLMIQAYGKLREASNTTLSVLDLFRYPTIRLLASAMRASENGAADFGQLARTQHQR